MLERLCEAGDVTALRTDEVGTIGFVTDGQQMWVRTERKDPDATETLHSAT